MMHNGPTTSPDAPTGFATGAARKFSVALAVYNGADRLPRQLQSLARQTRRPDELVVFDDCSTDGSVAVLRRFADSAPFPMRVHCQSRNVGSTRNFNCAIEATSGDFIALCDQDDVWLPNKLATLESALATGAGMAFSDAHIVDSLLQPTGKRLWPSLGFTPRQQYRIEHGHGVDLLLRANVVAGASMAFAARHKAMVLPIDEGWVHDAWISLLIAAVDRCQPIAEPLFCYREHGHQQIGPAPTTAAAKWSKARGMDRDYFQRLATNFARAAARLSGSGAPPAVLQHIQEKAAHCRARASMRQTGSSPLARPILIAREWFHRRYFRYSLGAASVVQDLLL